MGCVAERVKALLLRGLCLHDLGSTRTLVTILPLGLDAYDDYLFLVVSNKQQIQ